MSDDLSVSDVRKRLEWFRNKPEYQGSASAFQSLTVPERFELLFYMVTQLSIAEVRRNRREREMLDRMRTRQ